MEGKQAIKDMLFVSGSMADQSVDDYHNEELDMQHLHVTSAQVSIAASLAVIADVMLRRALADGVYPRGEPDYLPHGRKQEG